MDNSVMDSVSDANQALVDSSLVTEKTIPQSQVNEIVGTLMAKREAAERKA